MLPGCNSVDKHGSNVGSAVKLQKVTLPGNVRWQLQFPAVAAHQLIGFVVSVVQRKFHRIVGQFHCLPFPLKMHKFFVPLGGKFPIAANACFHVRSP